MSQRNCLPEAKEKHMKARCQSQDTGSKIRDRTDSRSKGHELTYLQATWSLAEMQTVSSRKMGVAHIPHYKGHGNGSWAANRNQIWGYTHLGKQDQSAGWSGRERTQVTPPLLTMHLGLVGLNQMQLRLSSLGLRRDSSNPSTPTRSCASGTGWLCTIMIFLCWRSMSCTDPRQTIVEQGDPHAGLGQFTLGLEEEKMSGSMFSIPSRWVLVW